MRTLLQRLQRPWPSLCACCGDWQEAPFCLACVRDFAQPRPRCRRCAVALTPGPGLATGVCEACTREPPPLTRCVAALDYAFPWSGAIARVKFQGHLGLAGFLGQLWRAAPGSEPLWEEADCRLVIPSGRARLRERGFHAVAVLARAFGGAALKHDVLRCHDRAHQVGATRAERQAQVAQAFWVDNAAPIQGRTVLVLDDVYTTGATLHAAARCLRDAGAREVWGLVLARTPD